MHDRKKKLPSKGTLAATFARQKIQRETKLTYTRLNSSARKNLRPLAKVFKANLKIFYEFKDILIPSF